MHKESLDCAHCPDEGRENRNHTGPRWINSIPRRSVVLSTIVESIQALRYKSVDDDWRVDVERPRVAACSLMRPSIPRKRLYAKKQYYLC